MKRLQKSPVKRQVKDNGTSKFVKNYRQEVGKFNYKGLVGNSVKERWETIKNVADRYVEKEQTVGYNPWVAEGIAERMTCLLYTSRCV